MKKIQLFVAIALFITAIGGCKKDADNNVSGGSLITDMNGLNSNLYIEGAIRMKGDIPVPSSGTYGGEMELLTTDVVLSDDQLSFEIKMQIDSSVIFFKIDGTEDYFELVLDRNGKAVQRGSDFRKQEVGLKGICCLPPCTWPPRFNNPAGKATIQTCRLQPGKTKKESLSSRQNWCSPRKINISAYGKFDIGKGQASVCGTSFGGICVAVPATISGCTGMDAVITGSGGTPQFILYNLPQQTSGTYQISTFSAPGCLPFILTNGIGTSTYQSVSGTVTKTGAKSFMFTAIIEDDNTGVKCSASGGGSLN